MIVAKFGGTSCATPARIKTLCQIIVSGVKKEPVVVVVSAIAGVTDLLLECASGIKVASNIAKIRQIHLALARRVFSNKALYGEFTSYLDANLDEVRKLARRKNGDRSDRDRIVSYGEIVSSYFVAEALRQAGVDAQQVTADRLIVTNNNFGVAEFLPSSTKKKVIRNLLPLIKAQKVAVVTGFIGATTKGQITTLGRGGSDYSASIIGYCLRAREIQIWTDVDGIFSADPRIVKHAKLLAQISFSEASEIAAFGAKVLHPRTIRPAVAKNIPVRVLNTFNPKGPGTLILEKAVNSEPISAISCKKKLVLVNIYSSEMLFSKGFLVKIFGVFSRHNISIDLVSVSEVSVSVTLDNEDGLSESVAEISKFATVGVKKGLGSISLVGEGIATSSKTIKRIFEILDKCGILVRMVSLGATDINVSLVVQYDQVEDGVRALHRGLIAQRSK